MWLIWADESNKNTHQREVSRERERERERVGKWDEMKRVSVLNQSNGRGGQSFPYLSDILPICAPLDLPHLSLFLPYCNQSQRKEEEEKAIVIAKSFFQVIIVQNNVCHYPLSYLNRNMRSERKRWDKGRKQQRIWPTTIQCIKNSPHDLVNTMDLNIA